jgi:hypothetical protein
MNPSILKTSISSHAIQPTALLLAPQILLLLPETSSIQITCEIVAMKTETLTVRAAASRKLRSNKGYRHYGIND